MVALELMIRHRARRDSHRLPFRSADPVEGTDAGQVRPRLPHRGRQLDEGASPQPRYPRQSVEPFPPAHYLHRLPQEGATTTAVSEVLPGPDDSVYPRKFDLLILDEVAQLCSIRQGRNTPLIRCGPRLSASWPRILNTSSSSRPRRTTATQRASRHLLELLDNQRFHRGTPPDRKQLECGDGAASEVGIAAEMGRLATISHNVCWSLWRFPIPRRRRRSTPACDNTPSLRQKRAEGQCREVCHRVRAEDSQEAALFQPGCLC